MDPHNLLERMVESPTVVTDPGASGSIPLTKFISVVEFTSGGARTLVTPPAAGMLLTLVNTSGSDVTVTSTRAVNKAGNTVLTIEDNDRITLQSIPVEGVNQWHVVANDGVALS